MIAETVPLMPPHEAIPVIEEILRGAKVREDDELLDELIRLVDGICPPKEHLWPAAMPAPPKRLSGKAVWRMVSGVLFYGVLLLAILAAFLFSGAPGEVKNLFGFSYFTVMTPSMKSSIPPGSLILTKKTDTDKLMAGDVITYFSSDAGATVTHRIVEVLHEEAAFRTQGDDNSSPDPEPVPAARVVGKVVLHVKGLGRVMLVMQDRIGWLLLIFGILLALSYTLAWLFRKDTPEPPKSTKKDKTRAQKSTASLTI